MYSEDSVSEITSGLSHVIGLPETELIHRGLISFIEKEIRLAEADIADLVDRQMLPRRGSVRGDQV